MREVRATAARSTVAYSDKKDKRKWSCMLWKLRSACSTTSNTVLSYAADTVNVQCYTIVAVIAECCANVMCNAHSLSTM
jgi:hypothetical protein